MEKVASWAGPVAAGLVQWPLGWSSSRVGPVAAFLFLF
jgi:hypothetical protein